MMLGTLPTAFANLEIERAENNNTPGPRAQKPRQQKQVTPITEN